MIRLSTLLWLVLVAAVSVAMFEVKFAVAELEDQLAKVNRAIMADNDTIHVLKAEWSYLAQPSRLDDLSRRYLALGPIGTAQLAAIDGVAMRPAAGADAAPAAMKTDAAKTDAAKPGAPAAGAKPTTTTPSMAPTRLANAKLRIDR
jgi:hypothetical protein